MPRRAEIWLAVFVAVGPGACKRKKPNLEPAPAAVASELPPEPVDSVADGELAEGDQEAFGFKLPRDLAVRGTFPDAVYAIGTAPFEAVANYVRKRVETVRVETGPAKTVFSNAKLRRDPNRVVRVEVAILRPGHVELVVRDQTPRPFDASISSEERMRRAGLSPDGKPIDDKQTK
jgi:transcription termination factor NusB